MIAYIKGQVAEVGADYIVVDHDGIGYQVFVPATVLEDIPAAGSEVKIFTYFYVREDMMCLYGFLSRDDLHVFKLLISVSGIGPKGALAILSAITPDHLRLAVMAGDAKTISKAPGVGNKTAQRLIIELKDKLKVEDVFGDAPEPDSGNSATVSDSKNEAMMAMVALGYSQSEALAAIRKCEITPEMSCEAILKLALKKIFTI